MPAITVLSSETYAAGTYYSQSFTSAAGAAAIQASGIMNASDVFSSSPTLTVHAQIEGSDDGQSWSFMGGGEWQSGPTDIDSGGNPTPPSVTIGIESWSPAMYRLATSLSQSTYIGFQAASLDASGNPL